MSDKTIFKYDENLVHPLTWKWIDKDGVPTVKLICKCGMKMNLNHDVDDNGVITPSLHHPLDENGCGFHVMGVLDGWEENGKK